MRWSRRIVIGLSILALCAGCSDPKGEGDSDIDVDGDVEGDGRDADRDGDAECDRDLVVDGDSDGDDDSDTSRCDGLASEFSEILADVVRCDDESQCRSHDFDAPKLIGCFTAVHDSAELSALGLLAEEWRSVGCETREYDCEPEPPSEIICTPTGRCRFVGEEYEQCEVHRAAFQREAERLNHCEDVSECVLVAVLNCGVRAACWIPINAGEDQTRLREIEREYAIVRCPYATCSCPLPELECQDGRCVEIY